MRGSENNKKKEKKRWQQQQQQQHPNQLVGQNANMKPRAQKTRTAQQVEGLPAGGNETMKNRLSAWQVVEGFGIEKCWGLK